MPEQKVGAKTDIEVSERLSDSKEAKQLFIESRSRLLDVNRWHKLCGALSAGFQLTDENGNEVQREARVHDYFKIDIPGPGTKTGKGFDWVQVEKIEEKKDEGADSESIIMTVRPAENPLKKEGDIAHFYTEDATSNFMLMRQRNEIIAAVHGRNEVPNTSTSKLIDKARNAVVGVTALAGLSTPQWSTLAHAWIKDGK